MNLRNRVQLIGRLGSDPEVKDFDNNKLANLSIATSDKYRNKSGEMVENTEWHRVSIWGKQAEIAEKYLTKGQEICIDGRLTTRKYEDKEGNTRYVTEVVCSEFLMLGKKEAVAS